MSPAFEIDAQSIQSKAPALERANPAAAPRAIPDAETSSVRRTEKETVYFGWLDCLRLAAIVEIVAFHVLDGARVPFIGGLGLPVFLLISSAMSTVVASRRGRRAVISSKFRKLGTAWLFWSFIYGLDLSLRMALGRSISQPVGASMLLYGTSTHLWFVPFSIASASVVACLHGPFHRRGALATIAVLATAAVALTVAGGAFRGSGPPLDQWGFAIASCPLGLMTGLMLIATDKRRRALAIGLIATVGICLFMPLDVDEFAVQSLRRLGLATLIVAGCCFLPGGPPIAFKRVIPGVMGVYFVHVLFQTKLTGLLHCWPAAHVGLVLGSSVLTVAILSRTRFRPFVWSR